MEENNLFNIMEQGQKLLEKGEFIKAIELYKNILGHDPENDPFVRNNLGLALFYSGNLQEALKIIEPNIKKSALPNPFGHSLASRIYVKLKNKKLAKDELNEAIVDFEQVLNSFRNKSQIPEYWWEYAISIFMAAGELENHRQVYELYRSWQKYLHDWKCKYMAGVAAFNLGRFRQAANCWASITDYENISINMQRVALMADRGIVPPFQIPYEPISSKMAEEINLKDFNDKNAADYIAKGNFKMVSLITIFNPDVPIDVVTTAVKALVKYGKEWGIQFGKELLSDTLISNEIKFAAVEELIALEVYKPDEGIPAVIDGKQTLIKVNKVEIVDKNDEDLNKALEKAKSLHKQGKIEDAIKLLNEVHTKWKMSPDTLLFLSYLHFELEEFESSLQILNMIDNVFPDHPLVMFHKALVYKEMGEYDEALNYLENIDVEETPFEFRKEVEYLKELINLISQDDFIKECLSEVDFIIEKYEEEKREAVENKTLPQNATLARGIKNMPATWLKVACDYHELPNYRFRNEREKALIEFLNDASNLNATIQKLGEEEIELLRYILENGGWSTIGPITRKFGSTKGDGFFWDKELPASNLGFLWFQCLVFVGKASIGGKRTRIAVIPVELRENLKQLIGIL